MHIVLCMVVLCCMVYVLVTQRICLYLSVIHCLCVCICVDCPCASYHDFIVFVTIAHNDSTTIRTAAILPRSFSSQYHLSSTVQPPPTTQSPAQSTIQSPTTMSPISNTTLNPHTQSTTTHNSTMSRNPPCNPPLNHHPTTIQPL